jgi:hypothetical protein
MHRLSERNISALILNTVPGSVAVLKCTGTVGFWVFEAAGDDFLASSRLERVSQ